MQRQVLTLSVLLVFLAVSYDADGQLKKLRTGTTIGEIKSVTSAKNKRDVEVEILSPGEERARRYTVGAQQKAVMAAVKAAGIGDRVEIAWFDTVEGLCIDTFKVLQKAKKKHE